MTTKSKSKSKLKYPCVDESGMTKEQKEESRWRRFEQERAKKRMKHDKHLPVDCHGCSVGMRWSKEEVLKLFTLIIANTKRAKRTNVKLVDICMALNRTDIGILGKLKRMGFLKRQEESFNLIPIEKMSIKRTEELMFDHPKVVELLLKNGWKISPLRKGLDSPVWWSMVRFSTKGMNEGMNEGKELDW